SSFSAICSPTSCRSAPDIGRMPEGPPQSCSSSSATKNLRRRGVIGPRTAPQPVNALARPGGPRYGPTCSGHGPLSRPPGQHAAEGRDRPTTSRRSPSLCPSPFSLDRSILLRRQMAASTAAEKVLDLTYTSLHVVKFRYVLRACLPHRLVPHSVAGDRCQVSSEPLRFFRQQARSA